MTVRDNKTPMQIPLLLPKPRQIALTGGIVSGWSQKAASPQVRVDSSAAKPQGYELRIDAQGVRITAHDQAGAFYARQTIAQLLRQYPRDIPALHVEDWPDFPNRGVMLDISRDKVPTMATLRAIVDQLAELKINQLQLYTEHTFAYRHHRIVWEKASPMTAEEIRELDAYCRQRFMELVPNQNSFGHMERWLKHPPYRTLSECPDGAFYWGRHRPPATLNPLDPGSIALIRELYDELLPNFTSRHFNVGCDETMELGMGRSKEECERVGKGRVYLDFLLKIHAHVRKHDRRMMFWGDIILHSPELIDQLPRDIIALEWGYEADHKFDEHGAAFARSGVPFYVCPGTSSWCSLSGRSDNAVANLRSAAKNGLKHGAIGYLNTDWGDMGHWQFWPISLLPIAFGAAVSWCGSSNTSVDHSAMDLHMFRDQAGVMSRLAFDLGNAYQHAGKTVINGSVLFWLLHARPDDPRAVEGLTPDGLRQAMHWIEQTVAPLGRARMSRPDASLVADEFLCTADTLIHACRRGLWLLDKSSVNPGHLREHLQPLLPLRRQLWLARNRPGGLDDSMTRFEAMLKEYL